MKEQGSSYRGMCSCEHVLREFTAEKLTWIHDQPRDFVESEWRFIPPKVFAVYRVLISLGVLGWMIYDMVHESMAHYIHMPAYWYLFATNWAFLLFAVTNLYLAVLCIIYNFRRDRTDPVCGYGLAWILYEISANCVIVTSLAFWFDFATLRGYPLFESTSSQVKHSLNACLIAFDLIFSAVPFRLVHFIYPFLVGTIYALFNLLYWLFKGPTPLGEGIIYPEIDWKQPGTSIGIIFVVFLVCLVVHCLLYAVYVLRHFVASFVCGRHSEEMEESEAILKPSESGYSAIETSGTEKQGYTMPTDNN